MPPVVACLHHLDQPFLGHAERPLRESGCTIDERSVERDELPRLDGVDGIISFGGAQSAIDLAAQPNLQREVELLQQAVANEIPVLGICLGGQLLARALGASVRRARRRTIAWRVLEPLTTDPLLNDLSRVPALHWNEDVFDLPPGAVEILGPRREGVEAFRFGPSAWGLQFHPEVDADALDRWYATYGPWLGEAAVKEEAARDLDRVHLPAQADAAAALFGAFATLVAQRTKSRT